MRPRRRATVTVERAGVQTRSTTLTAVGVSAAVARLESELDVTITIELNDTDERLMIAVDGSLAFLGLERTDGLFQFATEVEGAAERELVIGGEPTCLDHRHLVDVSTAAAVAREWFKQGEQWSYGWWERQ